MNTFPQPKRTRSSARTIAKWQQHVAAQKNIRTSAVGVLPRAQAQPQIFQPVEVPAGKAGNEGADSNNVNCKTRARSRHCETGSSRLNVNATDFCNDRTAKELYRESPIAERDCAGVCVAHCASAIATAN